MRQLQMKHVISGQLFVVGLGLLCAGPARAAFTSVTHCGQVLAASGDYVLASDLDCSGTAANGLQITASDVVLHLAGHTVSSTDCDSTKAISGIVMDSGASRVKVDGGTVKGFNDGIILYSSSSTVTGVTVTGACIFGIAISGADNRVDTSVLTQSGLDGIAIGAATRIQIRNNDISDNARVGVDISDFSTDSVVENNIINRNGIRDGEQGGVAIFNGTGNLIANNAINYNFNGIEVESPNNTVRGNVVSGSVSTGIFIVSIGSPSVVRLNTVLGSGVADMSDDSSTCSANTWRKNTFVTDLAGSASDGGPGTGCIR